VLDFCGPGRTRTYDQRIRTVYGARTHDIMFIVNFSFDELLS